MSKNANKLYIVFIATIAFSMLFAFGNLGYVFDWRSVLFWSFLGMISETFHLISPSGAATSVGMAIYLASAMTTNPLIASIVPIISFLCRIPEVDGVRKPFYKYKWNVLLYNISSHVIFVGVMSYAYHIIVNDETTFSDKVLIALVMMSVVELLSILLISAYYYTLSGVSEIPLLKSFAGALPSTWTVGALGLLLVYAFDKYDYAIVLLFFAPLLLARYFFKLYFDSQRSSQETIEALNEALFVRDAYTAGHTTRVEEYAILLAKATNYTAKDLETLTRAAKLHDIGKIGVPDGILNKPGKLTQEEYFQIRDHAAMGHKILSNVDSLKKVAEVVRHHHERPDGKGYPDGLKDNEIPRDSAILAIADTFDAMTSDRPYRKALSKEQALAELEKYKGTQFNQFLAEVFISIMKEYDSRKPQEVVAITEVAKHEHVDEKKVASTTLSKAVARHKKETVRLAEEVAE